MHNFKNIVKAPCLIFILIIIIFSLPKFAVAQLSEKDSAYFDEFTAKIDLEEIKKSLPRYVPHVILIKVKNGHSISELKDLNSQNNVEKVNSISLSQEFETFIGGKLYRIKLNTESDIESVLSSYRSDPAVSDARRCAIYYSNLIPNDTYFNTWQRNLRQNSDKDIDADLAWNITTGSTSVKIGVIDTGVDTNHPDLVSNLLSGYDFTDVDYFDGLWTTVGDYSAADNNPHDEFGHGTHVSGILGAKGNNSQGIAGVTWNSKILPIRAGFSMQYYYYEYYSAGFSVDNLISAIDYAKTQNCDIINMSLGGPTDDSDLHSALTLAYNSGILIVASAGNDGETDPLYPAAYSEVIGVASSDINDSKSWFSNYGSWIDVAAPGGTSAQGNYTAEDITSTMPMYTDFYMNTNIVGWDASEYWPLKGTSMATPQISGIAALLWSERSTLTREEVKTIILSSAEQVGGYYYNPSTGKSLELGHGRANAYLALRQIPLAFYITGPSILMFKEYGTWTAHPSGGTGNYSYEWRYRYYGVGNWSEIVSTSQSYTKRMEFDDFEVQVKVMDGESYVYNTKYVEYSDELLPKNVVPKDEIVATNFPECFALQQNYPNPFNPVTTIRYQLPRNSYVILSIYNLQGQLIIKLVDKNQDSGYHFVEWNAIDQPSGTYICRFEASNFISTQKLVLLK